jgi:YrbI family 3-deoxy-D-manno-octulosonate 8-phosphate phosphatase
MELLKKNINFLLSEISGANISSELRMALDHYVKAKSTLIDPSLLKQLSNETAWLVDTLLLEEIELRSTVPADIKMLIFDVDGVMTDAGMYYSESGEESKRFNSRDGLAIRNLNKLGWKTGIISHGININLIKRRADLLGISHVYAGNRPKTDVLAEWCNELNLSFSQIAFIGDDINDLPIIRVVGFSACPADALNAVKKEVNMVLSSRGGNGAIREWIDRCFPNEHHS